MTASITEQPAAKSHVPAALVAKRQAEKAARESSVAGPDGTSTPSATNNVLATPKAKRPAAKAAAPAGRSDKAKAADKRRTLERVDPERMRSALAESGLTNKEAAAAVGRSVSLLRGWLGSSPVKAGRIQNPPLASHRLKEVERTWMTAGRAKAKKAAKA